MERTPWDNVKSSLSLCFIWFDSEGTLCLPIQSEGTPLIQNRILQLTTFANTHSTNLTRPLPRLHLL